ncbi:hypothetical protein [Rhizobium mongolense]|uniref:Uncharacterized protein n=1 Tax=Rhizobium mongolense TaxID=57676 RepID=A0A7W6RK76_9HYPH|nr:hypothetical protein [Rhizobium mongolense]MBB4274003.1 hypothetical protein [Rhizobium mongolense]
MFERPELGIENENFTFTSGISCVACAESLVFVCFTVAYAHSLTQALCDPRQDTGEHHPAHSVTATSASGVSIALANKLPSTE